MDNLLITICARGDSKGVKNKNIRSLNSYPLIYYTIRQALEWGKGKHLVVTTDSEEIAEIAKKYGAEVPFLRPAHLATDTAPTLPVLQHALQKCEEIYKQKFDYVMDLPVTSPIRKMEDFNKAIELFLEKAPKTLVSVVPASRNPYFNMLEETENGRVFYSKPNTGFFRRQDAPKVYDMNNSIYIYSSDYLRDEKNNKAVSDDTVAFLMDQISFVDIDNELDFKFIEFLIKEGIVSL